MPNGKHASDDNDHVPPHTIAPQHTHPDDAMAEDTTMSSSATAAGLQDVLVMSAASSTLAPLPHCSSRPRSASPNHLLVQVAGLAKRKSSSAESGDSK